MECRGNYRRALVKLSGSAFAAPGGGGLEQERVAYITREVAAGRQVCPELAVVVGGGNILRGAESQARGVGRVQADYAGMVATLVNALLLQDGLQRAGVEAVLYSALPVGQVARPFNPQSCREELRRGRLAILAGGTGNPLLTTDTAAAVRAIELQAQILLKATRVDGVYSADPERDASARLFRTLSYEQVLREGLGVMDPCAVSLCREHELRVRVFNYQKPGNIRLALEGESIGTLIGSGDDGH